MRSWSTRLSFVGIIALAALAFYAIWPDEPDRYLPDAFPWPSGRGVPSKVAGIQLPCRDAASRQQVDSSDCRGMTLGLDLRGGSRTVLQADLPGATDVELKEGLQANKERIESRVNASGVSEAVVQRSGSDRIIVELPGVSTEKAKDLIRPAILRFCEGLQQGRQGGIESPIATVPQGADPVYKPGSCEPDVDAAGQVAVRSADGTISRVTPTYLPIQTIDVAGNRDRIVWTPSKGTLDGAPAVMTGSFLKRATTIQFDQFGRPQLVFSMTKEGQQVFGSLTERLIGLPLATFLDDDPVRSPDGHIIAPTIQSRIDDTGTTSGLSIVEAQRLKRFLNDGAFPVPMKIVQEQQVDATLGEEAVLHSVEAGIIAMLLIMGFMTLYYRFPGVLASLALAVYTAIVLAIFKIGLPGIGPVALTLAGIAAFVLSVGMAVDANILIFERMKEELRNGRSLVVAIEAGFHRAWASIRDSNVSTLITCVILYAMGNAFGSSPIKGFALTLAIGVLISMFSAILVTRTLLRTVIGTPLARPLWLWTDDKRDSRAPAPAMTGAEGVEHA